MNRIELMPSDDEQEAYASSGEDWTPQSEEVKKKRTIRTITRSRKKSKISRNTSSDSDEEIVKRNNSASKNRSRSSRYPFVGSKICARDFSSGSFLVLKKDVQIGDTSKPPCLWRIDGKALLQKYEPFSDRGKTLHRSTSIYTGWSALDQDLYSPVTVQVEATGQEVVVELDWSTLHTAIDSD